jgi:hypothetical protein
MVKGLAHAVVKSAAPRPQGGEVRLTGFSA